MIKCLGIKFRGNNNVVSYKIKKPDKHLNFKVYYGYFKVIK